MPIDRKPEFFKGAQLKVAIIGCGYVGLPLALRFAEAGHKVTGFDTDPNKVNMLNAGRSYIEHIPQTKIQQFVNSRHFGATTDFARLKEADAILICVPTPLDERREPDLSYVEKTTMLHAIFGWRFLRNAKIRGISSLVWRRFPKWSAG